MLRRLVELKEFCNDFIGVDDELYLTEEEWQAIGGVVSALAPAQEATVILQQEQLTVGDFYGSWLKCRIETSKVDNSIAIQTAAAMKRREKLLLGNDLFCAAIFLDPRYHVTLTSEERPSNTCC